MVDTKAHDVSIVVLSCDKYKDLWDPFFALFFRFWPSCKFPVYLFANHKTYDHPRVLTILSGKDLDWSSSIKKCLLQVKTDYVWIFFDDVFLVEPVEMAKISKLLKLIKDERPNYLRFRTYPKPDLRVTKDFGLCNSDTLYRTSIFAIWKKDVLIDLLKNGESAWDFERLSVARSEGLGEFYGVYEDFFTYEHGVERGVWIPSASKRLIKLGVKLDLDSRPLMRGKVYIDYFVRYVKTNIFNITPNYFKPYLYKASSLLRKAFAQ